ncbi:hypothetical protein BH24ACT12_BH24ACT12_02300 [soil metagenome]
MTFASIDEMDVSLEHGSVYEHGWQSWSPTSTYSMSQISPRPEQGWQHLMRFRPETPAAPHGFQAEGLLVVDPGTGSPSKVYTARDPRQEVPSIRAQLVGNRLVIAADAPVTVESTAAGIEPALDRFGGQSTARLGAGAPRTAPTVWCSWYHYFLDVTEDDIVENLAGIDSHRLPVDVVQIDDGWQAGVGDWLELSGRFSSLSGLAARIMDSGRRAGIWVAPFVVGSRSVLAREHPDWLVGEAGWNWGQDLLGLDLTHPGARDYVWSVFRRLREAGYDYFKLDFLYAGALAGRRYADLTGVPAYRSGLDLIRDAVGSESYLVGCGAPILPSVGLVDAMRVAPDTYHPTDAEDEQRRLRGRSCVMARAWQHGRFWVNDADCLVARPSFAARREWAQIIERYGGLRSASDRIADLDDWGMETTRRLLATAPPPTPFPPGR